MAWIESHGALGAHPKTRKLARVLDVSRVTAVGHLQFFWWWAMDYAPDGDLAKHDALDIAIGAEWEANPDDFVNAMVNSGFIDRNENGMLSIHDWNQYGGKLIQRKQANADRMKTARATNEPDTKPTDASAKTDSATHVQHTSETRVGPEERRGEESTGETYEQGQPTVETPQAAKTAPDGPKPEPPKPERPKSPGKIAAERLYERRMVIFEAYCRGLGIALDSLSANQRKGPSLNALSQLILDTPECSPDVVEPLTRFAATKFKWREGRTTPSLAEVLAALPEWEEAGRPEQPMPANVKKLDWNDHRRFKEGVGTGIIG